ncbi:MAG: hypothetical protein Q9200_003415, partial [Gallowayella weberi]
MFYCEQPKCSASFIRANNLRIHCIQCHGLLSLPSTTDVNQVTLQGPLESGTKPPVREASSSRSESLFLSDPKNGCSQSTDDDEGSVASTEVSEVVSRYSHMPLLIEEDSSNTPSSADELEDTNPSSNRKRKGTTPFNDRVLRAKVLPPAPEYEVTESPAIPGQQQGIEWLTANSKKLFDLVFANVVGRSGGVTPTHQGTCVLCFKDSGQDNSSAELRHLPSLQSSPLMYQYSDYSTTFTRAVGWFGLWRRT